MKRHERPKNLVEWHRLAKNSLHVATVSIAEFKKKHGISKRCGEETLLVEAMKISQTAAKRVHKWSLSRAYWSGVMELLHGGNAKWQK